MSGPKDSQLLKRSSNTFSDHCQDVDNVLHYQPIIKMGKSFFLGNFLCPPVGLSAVAPDRACKGSQTFQLLIVTY